MTDERKVWEFNDFDAINKGVAAWNAQKGVMAGVYTPEQALAANKLPTGVSTIKTPGGGYKPSTKTQQQAQMVINDPGQVEAIAKQELGDASFADRAKTMLSRVFDYEDEADLRVGPVNLSGVESVWDNMLRGFNWGYDRLNQVTTAGISGLPGGIRTLTWNEAGKVSVGQAFLASMGAAAGRAERGEGTFGDVLMAPFTGFSTLAAQLDTNNILQEESFDIMDDAQRKAAFEDDEWGKWTSGLLDASFAIFGDPLIVGGKFLKLTRLKYIDRPLTPENKAAFISEVTNDTLKIASGDATNLTPVGRWMYGAITPDETGRLPSGYRVIERGEIKDSSDAAGIASAIDTINAIAPGADQVGERAKLLALTLRVAANDDAAVRELYESSAILAEELVSSRHQLFMQELIVNPARKDKIFLEIDGKYQRAVKYHDLLLQRGTASNEELSLAMRNVEDLKRLRDDIDNFRAPDPLAVPEEAGSQAAKDQQEILKAQVANLEERNDFFAAAMRTERKGSFIGSDRFFASDTALGRAVSKRRERRAQRAYEIKATAAGGWTHRDFFGNGLGKKIFRIWSYAGLENPTPYMTTKGTGGMFAWKNAQAFLDKIKMYSGEGRVVGDRVVGGIARKEELFAEFIKAMDETGDASLAVTRIENLMQADFVSYYGMAPELMEAVVSKSRSAYKNYEDFIMGTNGLFPDGINGAEELTKVLNIAPNLPGQLAEGRYILPFEEIEQIIINGQAGKIPGFAEGNIIRPIDSVTEKVMTGLDNFNDIWRPAVLFRLGYVQRNVAEGIFRSMAFNSSFAPIAWAGQAGAIGLSNFRRSQRVARKEAKIRAALLAPDAARDEFDRAVKGLMTEQDALRLESNRLFKLRGQLATPETIAAAQVVKRGSAYVTADNNYRIIKEGKSWNIQRVDNETFEYVNVEGMSFASLKKAKEGLETNLTGRKTSVVDEATGTTYNSREEIDAVIAADEARINQLTEELKAMPDRPVPASMKNSRFQKWREKNIEEMENQYQAGVAYEQNVLETLRESGVAMDDVIEQNLRVLRYNNEKLMRDMLLVERDDIYALSVWRDAASTKKRVKSNGNIPIPGRPDLFVHDALDGPYGPIGAELASSDNTIRATLSLRMATMQHIFLKARYKNWVNVMPDQGDAYWQGMSDMLRQYNSSELGKLLLGPGSDEDVVVWLLSEKGKQVREQLNDAYEFGIASLQRNGKSIEQLGQGKRIGSIDTALKYVQDMRQALSIIIAGDARVAALALDHAPSPGELKRLLDGNPNLQPVIGHTDELTGEVSSVMEVIRNVSAKAFKYIGTMPEDAFVRMPFYAKRYRDFVKIAINDLLEQYPDVNMIPANRALEIQVQASRRALKDTKDFLYTIDRRTNLGRYGELIFPFISAQQNSVNAIGKLFRRDPSLPGIMLLLWNAPNRVGWEDEEGNIQIPLPMDLVPQGAKDAVKFLTLGKAELPSFTSLKIPKSGLNSIFPESGFAFVPRPMPLVQVGASELMKRSLFIGPEAPPILVNFLGAEDADTLWTYFKNYIFGEESTLSTQPLSADKVLPPWMQKAMQMIQNDSASQYSFQYGLQARQADMEWQAGLRDEYPTAEEIQAKTNGMFLLRMLGNLVGYTSPQYDSPVNLLVDLQNRYDQEFGLQGPMKFSNTFGNELLLLAETKSTESVGGALATTEVVRNIKKYDTLIREVAPSLGDDTDVIGIFVNGDASNAEYDPNSYRWQLQSLIPGTSRTWREVRTGQEAMNESQRQAGWVEYIKFMGMLDVLLQQRGLENYRVKGAQDLQEMKAQFIDGMMNNPMYEGWAIDYQSRGSAKTYNSVRAIEAALGNEEFMNDNGSKRTWQIAALYVSARNEVIRRVQESGQGINTEDNAQLKYEWDTLRQRFINDDIGWAAIANRYLRNDDDPVMIGASMRAEATNVNNE